MKKFKLDTGLPIGPRRPIRYLLKMWREERGLTRQQLGEKSKTGVDRVIAVECRGESTNLAEIHAWARTLNVQPSQLVD